MGLNTPNRLYLLKPIVSEEDIYKISQLEEVPKEAEAIPPKKKQKLTSNNGTSNNEVPKETLKTKGTSNNEVPSKPLLNLGTLKNGA